LPEQKYIKCAGFNRKLKGVDIGESNFTANNSYTRDYWEIEVPVTPVT